jgi:mannose-1-phosphate guanylyltransferase/mannose-6-phosphate isomerase
MIIPVILSGGSGTRLWPLSRSGYPKQFLSLVANQPNTMLQHTYARLESSTVEPPIVIANHEHRFRIAEQLQQIGVEKAKIVLEPFGRNTAPAVLIAALMVATGPQARRDACLLILPSDHHMENIPAFNQAVQRAYAHAMQGRLVTFGIQPTHPATGFGYIQAGDALGDNAYRVQQFKEKPDEATAQGFLEAGNYTWNSGMFMMKATTLLEEAEVHCPEVLKGAKAALLQGRKDLDFIRLDEKAFEATPSISVDYAIMERTRNACVVPLEAGWNDVGNWSSLWEISEKDHDQNAIYGDVILHNVSNSLVFSQNSLVALCDVDDLLVVQTTDAVLIANRHKAESVKHLVDELKKRQRGEHLNHVQVFRPWGSYETIVEAHGFKAKRIVVNPQQKLSLQMHHHRAEHWVVVRGTANVVNGEKEFLLSQDESTYIPIGTKHRLENPGKIPLEIIEVQSGAYLEEDDIVRFEDIYQRT